MFRLPDDDLVLSASDITDLLACPHLIQQRLAVATGARARSRPVDDPHAEIIRERGDTHERAELERISAECGGHVALSPEGAGSTRGELQRETARAIAAMRDGAPLIYQASLFDGRWVGRVDFLRRTDAASHFGDYAYEIVDTKLARAVKPAAVHQLSLYNRMLAAIQGHMPAYAYLVLGDGKTEAIELTRYAALHRYVAARLERLVGEPAVVTYPEPVAHCPVCDFAAECRSTLVRDDHLSLVAGARREVRERLRRDAIDTVQLLADAPDEPVPPGLRTEQFETLHHQAALQIRSRETGEPTHRHLPATRARGYAALPDPSPGDVFFDLEGDPYIGDGGIEYLWGWWTVEDDYHCEWAHDATGERAAFERFVDCVIALRARHPRMHVYHYAPHERSKLSSLSLVYATREAEIDALLRTGTLVDLFGVVRQGLQVGEESYSLKRVERHYGFNRQEQRVREGGGSIVAYENWLQTGDDDLLKAIRAYNEEDCRSTADLRDWLVATMMPEAERVLGVSFAELREPEPEEPPAPPEWMAEAEALVEKLSAGLPADPSDDSPADAERRLLAHLLLYHHRESKPSWWRHFALRRVSLADLIDDRDAIGGLVRDESIRPIPVARSLDYTFTFPGQEFKLGTGTLEDPLDGARHRVVAITDDRLVVRRGATAAPPSPQALVEQGPPHTAVIRESLAALATGVLDRTVGPQSVLRRLLRRDPPGLSDELLGEDAETLARAALALQDSVLPVQGPPGTGKTFRAARMIVAALNAGRRVGITASSHAAIQNLLREVEQCAHGVDFRGIYKGDGYESARGLIETTDNNSHVTDDYDLVAGTAWLFSRHEHEAKFSLLFVDEAGQYSLAGALAVARAADNLVLLGDPQQLPQVNQASHPPGSEASVLEHMLNGASTIAPGAGVLLTETWRLHPDICAFVSERSYDERLRSRAGCERRGITARFGRLDGAGLRRIPVVHEGRSQASPEEADAIAAACGELLEGSTVADAEGRERTLTSRDIVVVAPYNMAVRCIRERVPAGIRVGTVDRFQGQEAPVVFYALTCSSAEDVPRGTSFLFDAHRLNVAISRAQCLATIVYSPRLLDANCATTGAMSLLDGICRAVELAEPLTT